MAEEHRRLAAIMFTDIVGYSALAQKNEELALHVLEEHRQLVRPLFLKFEGQEVKTMGDAFLIEFNSALLAVRCAIDMQKVVIEHNASCLPDHKFAIRIGIHVGDVVFREHDVLGDAVNITSRIQSLAEPGGIWITEQVYDHVRNKLEVATAKVDKQKLKNIQTPVEIYRLLLPWQKSAMESEDRTLKPSAGHLKSIAVLPFVNMSPDPENEYFSDGITEEIINALTKIEGLKVTSRTSAFSFKGKKEPLPKIGEQLGVTAVLEGSVRKAGNRIRITAQLINLPEDAHLWSEHYDRELKDIFAIQDEISSAIVSTLRVKLAREENTSLVKRYTENVEAYSLYLQGRYFLAKRSEAALTKAIECFQHAIEIDADYALAFSGLADSYILLAEYGYRSPQEASSKAEEETSRALAIDGTLPEAHLSLALIKAGYAWSWEEAERSFQLAIEFNPGSADAHYQYGFHLMNMRRFDEAKAEMKRAQELDPLSRIVNRNLGLAEYYAGRLGEAERQLRKAEAMDPNYVYTHLFLGWVYLRQRLYERALAEFQRERQLFAKVSTFTEAYLAWGLVLTGKKPEAQSLVQGMVRRSKKEYVRPYALALAYLAIGDRDKSLEQLHRAYEERDPYLRFIKVDPTLEEIRSDPRYAELMKKMGLED